MGNTNFMGVFWAQFRGRVASPLAISAPETRTAAQRETARRHRAALEYSEIVPQEGLEPPTYGLEVRRSIL